MIVAALRAKPDIKSPLLPVGTGLEVSLCFYV